MIGEEIKDLLKEITLEDLRKITWDYSQEGVLGIYYGEIIRGFLFDVKEYGDINPLTITRCNVVQGWIEHIECNTPEELVRNPLQSNIKYGVDGEAIKIKVLCKVVVDLFDAKGNVIVTLS